MRTYLDELIGAMTWIINGVTQTRRSKTRLVAGAGMTLTPVDNATDRETQITLALLFASEYAE